MGLLTWFQVMVGQHQLGIGEAGLSVHGQLVGIIAHFGSLEPVHCLRDVTSQVSRYIEGSLSRR